MTPFTPRSSPSWTVPWIAERTVRWTLRDAARWGVRCCARLVVPLGLRSTLINSGFAILLALSAHGTALAHAALVKAEPARRATLSKPPQRLRLWFNEKLEPAYASVSLSREGQGAVAIGAAKVDAADPKLLVLELPALEPGVYMVKYRVLSVDGHTVDHGYSFTLKASAPSP